jgi:hypothetical protein
MTAQVPADRAEAALRDFLLDLLRGWPDWLRAVYRLTCDAVGAAAARVPEERERDEKRAAELGRQIANFVAAVAGGLTSAAVVGGLQAAEAEKAAIDARLTANAAIDPAAVAMPDEAWVAARLGEWVDGAAGADGPCSLLRLALASAVAEPVVAAGKARVRAAAVPGAGVGCARRCGRRRTARGGPRLSAGGGRGRQPGVRHRPGRADGDGSVGAADRGVARRGVIWTEIVRRTGMDLNRVYVAWKRYTGEAGDASPAA